MWHWCNLAAKESGQECTLTSKMMTSLYYSVGVVDAIEWACVCVAITLKNDWASRTMDLHQICIELKHSSMETIQMIQKFLRDNAVSAAQIKMWYKCFKDGWESAESDPRSGRPATSGAPEDAERVWAAINKDRRLTVWELEADLRIPNTTASEIWRRILAWNVLWQNSFCGFSYQSRRNIML